MNIKDYLKRNGMTLILLVGMIILYLCIPSQIAENLVARATISPRFFPTFSVLGVIVCCALLLVFDAKEHIFSHKTAEAAATQEKKEEISYVRVVLVALLLLARYILMPRIGFIISTIVIMCIMSYLLGCRNKIVLVAFPVLFTLTLYFAFVVLLHVSLPEILF